MTLPNGNKSVDTGGNVPDYPYSQALYFLTEDYLINTNMSAHDVIEELELKIKEMRKEHGDKP